MKKLVRDKIIDFIKNRGEKPDFYVADQQEYVKTLFDKLLEESKEVFEEQDNLEKLKEELGDLFEIIYSIMKTKNISLGEVEEIRKQKKEKNGGFDKKYILNLDNLGKNK